MYMMFVAVVRYDEWSMCHDIFEMSYAIVPVSGVIDKSRVPNMVPLCEKYFCFILRYLC